MVTTQSPTHVVTTQSPIHVVTTQSLIHVVTTHWLSHPSNPCGDYSVWVSQSLCPTVSPSIRCPHGTYTDTLNIYIIYNTSFVSHYNYKNSKIWPKSQAYQYHYQYQCRCCIVYGTSSTTTVTTSNTVVEEVKQVLTEIRIMWIIMTSSSGNMFCSQCRSCDL